ncbi:acyltransferase family protein [uncultured Helicobacter sp.]|uniref:acyltransferase family protein n=1 Tax=uncultured Helicobacter sp. TaxID=175537 RepID=UPI0037517BE5
MADKNAHLGALDSFRGIAALSVVIYHLYIISAVSEWEFFRYSHLFVPFFFVLSGFVIAYVYDKSSFRFKDFMIARSFRILPLYYIMLACFLALECLNYVLYYKFGLFFKNIPFSEDRGLDQIVPNILLLQSWLPWTYPLSFNNPAWSLSVEWYLYIFFGILMFVPRFTRYGVFLLCASLAYFHLLGFLRSESLSGVLYFCSGALVYWLFALCKLRTIPPLLLTTLEILLIILSAYIIAHNHAQYAVFVFGALVFVFGFSSYQHRRVIGGGGSRLFVRI